MPVEIIDHSLHKIRLQKAILLYGRDEHTPTFATVHPIDVPERGQPVIRAGNPVDRRSLEAFATALSGANRTGMGMLPPNVLSIGPTHTVWWSPPAKRSVFFRAREADDEDDDEKVSVGKRRGITPHPGLIFVVKEDAWYVFAVKGDQRPTADTELFVAPYFNVWVGGQVCTGNVRLPRSLLADQIKAWEAAFFESNFTHPNTSFLVRHEGGAHQLWIDLLDKKFEHFPETVLIPLREQAHRERSRSRPKKPLPPTTITHLIAHFEATQAS